MFWMHRCESDSSQTPGREAKRRIFSEMSGHSFEPNNLKDFRFMPNPLRISILAGLISIMNEKLKTIWQLFWFPADLQRHCRCILMPSLSDRWIFAFCLVSFRDVCHSSDTGAIFVVTFFYSHTKSVLTSASRHLKCKEVNS